MLIHSLSDFSSTASVVLVSSNPTNLVLSGAFGISFMKYTAHVILPFLTAAVLVYPVFVYGLYRSDALIPRQLQAELGDEQDNNSVFIDKNGAIFGSALLLTTLAVLVGTSTVGVPVWQVTVPPAIVCLLRDALHDWSHNRASPPQVEAEPRRSVSPTSEYAMSDLGQSNETQGTVASPDGTVEAVSVRSSPAPLTARPQQPRHDSLADKLTRWENVLSANFPTVTTIMRRLPIPLVPFAFLMFILVQGLSVQGWVEVFAGWWVAWVNKTGTIGAVGGMAFVSCIMCNVGNICAQFWSLLTHYPDMRH